MDKNAIKKYAVWARNELIARVTQKAEQYEITEKKTTPAEADSIGGRLLSEAEKKQRAALIEKIKTDGFEQVMEEVAYTWFNRFTALRFMEVNNYLPSHTRVFTNEAGEFKPQILADAIHLDLEGLDMDKVIELKDANRSEELYKYLLIVQCNELSKFLPRMFQSISDYTELLLPDYLLREGSVIEQMIATIDDKDWLNDVEIIGWLYQFYIAEPKDDLINAHKKYAKDEVPFVTQLFTPDWIVKYMVENTLGRFWIEHGNNPEIKNNWEYYISLDEEVSALEKVAPRDIRCIDPCMGSGHILCYLFDVLVQIYEAYGYTSRDAVSEIVKYNLYGIDIDERACQLAYFSIMMKARKHDRRFLTKGIEPNVFCACESNCIDAGFGEYFCNDRSIRKSYDALLSVFRDGRIIGSALVVDDVDMDVISNRLKEVMDENNMFSYMAERWLKPIISMYTAIKTKYQVVVTNPPYLNSSYMPDVLKTYVQKNYPEFKGDMFAVFAKKTIEMCERNGHVGLLMPYVWMFISTYEKMRDWINRNAEITTLIQLEYNAFEAACVPVATLTMKKGADRRNGEYIKLSEFRGADNQAPRTLAAIRDKTCGYRFSANQKDFESIPGSPLAYWVGKSVFNAFSKDTLSSVSEARVGLATGRNDYYLRLWFEVPFESIGFNMDRNRAKESGLRWFPYNKGGAYRKWYGNRDFVVNWKDDGIELQTTKHPDGHRIWAHNFNLDHIFKENISWSDITSSDISFRAFEKGFLFDSTGTEAFTSTDNYYYVLGYVNSKFVNSMTKILNPTIHFTPGDFGSLPFIEPTTEQKMEIESLVKDNIEISKRDWDSFETSWDFKIHPLIRGKNTIAESFDEWSKECEERFERLKKNEERINEIINSIYGVEDTFTPDVEEDKISIRKADLEREIKSLLSFAVGCMFGRYTPKDYIDDSFVDKDNIIPICDDEYFEDDIVSRFCIFIEKIFGAEYLEENLMFISNVLGGKGSSRDNIRSYYLNKFFSDHGNDYSVIGSGKRPIYWLFDSGKKNGFKCLIYSHRYQPDTIARIRTDYVHELQSRYRTIIEDLTKRSNDKSTSEKVKLNKRIATVSDQAEELRLFEEKIHHLADQMIKIDLNDGFKYNYAIFGDVLAKVK
ncbi:BREX-1 system adenine-specific DNA-methyltransferase PglX [Butyrivibrio fibrisolvens]|uniref:BREX-1 system adenine-specific DNA-methyltransferase PglX n=1 Tax=Butyrivibrio fibrisolvens TaxID=831 RepID=UPI00040F8A5A|nr:BREX-1 system adenine-specific DNA-methyltransferase PglX [Butyrivibrio fibrisolvens]